MVIFIIFTYVHLYGSVCGYTRASTCGTWKTASEFLRLESQVVVNCPVSVPGTEPESSARTVPALARYAIFSVFTVYILMNMIDSNVNQWDHKGKPSS